MKFINDGLLLAASLLLVVLLGLYTYFSFENQSMTERLQASNLKFNQTVRQSQQVASQANQLRPFLLNIVRRVSEAPETDKQVKALLEKYQIKYTP